jgi:hypothetical protein
MDLEDVGAILPELLLTGAIFTVLLGISNCENPLRVINNTTNK